MERAWHMQGTPVAGHATAPIGTYVFCPDRLGTRLDTVAAPQGIAFDGSSVWVAGTNVTKLRVTDASKM